jgi:geranylgeranyl reductase family protein
MVEEPARDRTCPGRPEHCDVAVVGGGPAGSLAAYRLASEGASVLLLERHRYPRDKPCGGGVTGRAARLLPFSIEPVVEDVVDRFEVRVGYRRAFCHPGPAPVVYMTQRRRLDAYLAQQAAAAGADLREGVRVTQVVQSGSGVDLETAGGRVRAAALVGADGVNGICARSLGLVAERSFGVALEGNLSFASLDERRYRGRAVIEIGTTPGGYGWVFAKGDHANFGVAGWEVQGPALRAELRRLCSVHGVSFTDLTDLRGYRLPVRGPRALLARGRSLLVGDAAGLVDPLSGDGMYEAFLSAKLAAQSVLETLSGASPAMDAYDRRLRLALDDTVAASWDAKLAVDRFPRLAFALIRPRPVWDIIERVIRGDLAHQNLARGVPSVPIMALSLLARLAGSPGHRYRRPLPQP